MHRPFAALTFLTLLVRFEALQVRPGDVGEGALYFPLVGVGLGATLSVFNPVLETHLASEVVSVALVAALAILTGASHLEGLKRTFDEMPGKNSFSNEQHGNGIFGLIAVVLVILFKVNSLEAIGETRNLSLLLTPTLARWGLIIFLYGAASAAEEPARDIAGQVRAWHLVVATVFVLAFTVFMAGRTGLWIALGVSLLALLSRTVVQYRRAGLTCDNMGAVVEMSEALSLVAFTTL